MSNADSQAVETYLSNVPAAEWAELQRIRQFVQQLVPDAVELMSYGLPAFKYKQRPLVYYGAFKDHLSLFPASGAITAMHDLLAGYEVTKGTIKFSLEHTLSDDVLRQIIEHRLSEINTAIVK